MLLIESYLGSKCSWVGGELVCLGSTFKDQDGNVDQERTAAALRGLDPVIMDDTNNYSRPEGQNVGNFLTDRNTSRVLAPPGGATQFSLGDEAPTTEKKPPAEVVQQPSVQPQGPPLAAVDDSEVSAGQVEMKNNYSRPGGMQNVGNFITDRNSSRVLAPPGGNSSISFG